MSNRCRSGLCAAAMAAMAIGLISTPTYGETNSTKFAGSWKGVVAATTPPGLTPFADLITFANEGSVIESRRYFVPASPLGPLLETSGHGAWERIGDREFDVHFVFLLQGAFGGAEIGTDNVHLRLRLDSKGAKPHGYFREHDQRHFLKSDLHGEWHL